MSHDPAIDEIRRARIELSRELGNDPKRFLEYFSALQEKQREEGHVYVEPPKRTSKLKEDSPAYTSKNSAK